MKQDLELILERKKIKPTAIRMLVLKQFMAHQEALSLKSIEDYFEKVDRSTLFRTIKTFVEHHLIHEVDDGSGAAKFALCQESCTCQFNELHLHFFCIKCKKTYCLTEIPIPKVALPAGFSFSMANFVIKGSCPSCAS